VIDSEKVLKNLEDILNNHAKLIIKNTPIKVLYAVHDHDTIVGYVQLGDAVLPLRVYIGENHIRVYIGEICFDTW
jgi:hypothetical protein